MVRRHLALLLLIAACSDAGVAMAPSDPIPAAPAQNDPAFLVEAERAWLLIGNALTPGHDALSIRVTAPSGVERVVPWLDGVAGSAATRDGNLFEVTVDASALAAGGYWVLLAADGADVAFAAVPFARSHPYYVVTTVDWDFADTDDDELAWHESLHALFPELLLTELVGPYTFTDPVVSTARAGVLRDWLLGMRDQHGDEIGLHIHAYCNFVDTTSVPCRHEPSLVYATPDTTGYTVELAAYSEAELTTLFAAADGIFEQNGLGKPTSFRAGAWAANDAVLKALAATGYVADTSANNWARLEEWTTPNVKPIYTWNQEHWSEIGDTSQPYVPSVTDVQQPGEPPITILEVPDNGSLVDYVDEAEMIDIFTQNWSGEPLVEPKAFSIGYHNSTLFHYRTRIEMTLGHASQFLASSGNGPVVFTTLSDTAKVWPP